MEKLKLGALISSGKDGWYAAYQAKKKGHTIACMITMESKNKASYMFHTPNVNLASLQAEASNIPLILQESEGVKEQELEDLEKAIILAKEKYKIEGIITGAVKSVYQATRIQKICAKHNLWCFNPIWQKDEKIYSEELIKEGFDIIISGIAAFPLDETWLGKPFDKDTIKELEVLNKKYQVSCCGEGGEFETFVLHCPLFSKKIVLEETEKEYENHYGFLHINKARLE